MSLVTPEEKKKNLGLELARCTAFSPQSLLVSPLFNAGKAVFGQVTLSGQALFGRVKANKSILYFCLLFFFLKPLSSCGGVGRDLGSDV